ncbi:hypothetical protein BDV32DRAFT_130195 [Aspergillus pseudonomiae]|uniref:Uncharacterized protein n=1 Tax=Aspergillus pseudonomiae TaxID=1506151 RepID=A0A5N6HQZ4_9EURO|nr:uncharacterized protein BDV37DRAFT_178082 [Aspergillus pseudonomiae]KAB8255810.1 hypothetical protein BDV32DRAFT_130195 [Aspergillus pseudonomiae]KAE8401564.1 hypothetical protein BDV37DRAFT_178082 [Aspergillus pseudonomiae]
MFSVIIPGRPCLTDIVPVDPQPNGQATKFAFTIPLTPDLSDLVVFLLPGTVLPPDTAAAIYIQFPSDPNGFRFIGALANEKPSSILPTSPPPNLQPGMTATLGISLEPIATVAPQLEALEAEKGASGQLVRQTRQITTKVLAQRIIGNAFNFLASFASSDQDAVPLKAFRDWWSKFERKVEMDPSFLEREDPSASG